MGLLDSIKKTLNWDPFTRYVLRKAEKGLEEAATSPPLLTLPEVPDEEDEEVKDAKQKERERLRRMRGRRSTILTGGQGVQGEPALFRKRLLGGPKSILAGD